MAEDQDQSQKTEEPTQRRIEEAVKKGQVAFSREVSSFLMLVVFTLTVAAFAPYLVKNLAQTLMQYIASPDAIAADPGNLSRNLIALLKDVALLVMIPALGAVIAAILSSVLQNGFLFSTESVAPNLERLSPLQGFKRIFSTKSLAEFLKGLLKIVIVGAISWVVIKPYIPKLAMLPTYDLSDLMAFLLVLLLKLLLGACIFMFAVSVLDYLYQRFEFMKSLRMTKQELKEEYKQTEGDPMVKGRLRQLRQQRARQRMITKVPEADVVITNPTHYAIALAYKPEKMDAPLVLAKGIDTVALKIREIAEEHEIPIVENPPLAQALFASVDIDETIPLEHYQAVAEVISYVYRLKKQTIH